MQKNFIHFTGKSYAEVLREQLFLKEEQDSNKLSFFYGEHDLVYTLGRSMGGSKFSSSIPFVETDRGGKLMHHGPGQLTLYPVFCLKDFFSGPKEYLCFVFKSLKSYFKLEYGLDLYEKEQGLWLGDKKVVYAGLRLSRSWVYHGFSINYFADLEPFKKLTPCNITAEEVGNLLDLSWRERISLAEEGRKISEQLALKLLKGPRLSDFAGGCADSQLGVDKAAN